MKTTITLLLILISSVTSSLFSQTATSKYLKATNHLWNICYELRTLKNSENQEEERSQVLPLVKKNFESAKKVYLSLSAESPNDENVKKLGLWIETIEKAYQNLNSDSWESNPTWQLVYTLIELDLRDFVNEKL